MKNNRFHFLMYPSGKDAWDGNLRLKKIFGGILTLKNKSWTVFILEKENKNNNPEVKTTWESFRPKTITLETFLQKKPSPKNQPQRDFVLLIKVIGGILSYMLMS